MGICRDGDAQEIELVKEMAEALGSTGIRLEKILEQVETARMEVDDLIHMYEGNRFGPAGLDLETVNESVRAYNRLVDKAEDARRWLLIQREACGFRTHRDVDLHYPVPTKVKLRKP
jgi:hypothetical protein